MDRSNWALVLQLRSVERVFVCLYADQTTTLTRKQGKILCFNFLVNARIVTYFDLDLYKFLDSLKATSHLWEKAFEVWRELKGLDEDGPPSCKKRKTATTFRISAKVSPQICRFIDVNVRLLQKLSKNPNMMIIFCSV